MGMYALIEDSRTKAREAANHWHETDEAKALLEKVDAYERLSDRWYGELIAVGQEFARQARRAMDDLDDLHDEAVKAAADAFADDRNSDEWLEAWDDIGNEVPTMADAVREARRGRAGDAYVQRFAA